MSGKASMTSRIARCGKAASLKNLADRCNFFAVSLDLMQVSRNSLLVAIVTFSLFVSLTVLGV